MIERGTQEETMKVWYSLNLQTKYKGVSQGVSQVLVRDTAYLE